MNLKQTLKAMLPAPILRPLKALKHRLDFGGLDHRQIFQKIHAENRWGDSESVSGAGSRIDVTEVFRGELERWLEEHQIRSLVDLPCGDFNWMRLVRFPETMTYLGVDVVDALIATNQSQHGRPGVSFTVADILTSDLPRADAYLVKDLFIHFPNVAMAEAVERVRARCRYLLVTTFPDTPTNVDIRFGDARRVNMNLVFGEPAEAMLPDFGAGVTDRFIGVWRGSL